MELLLNMHINIYWQNFSLNFHQSAADYIWQNWPDCSGSAYIRIIILSY